MINLFTPSSNDQSLYYLAYIFKGMQKVITGEPSAASMLGEMFTLLNSVILSVAALIVVYTIVVGVLKTAQEGEFLGKHWNSLWVPIRTVIGIAALIPSTAGYSAVQIVMMWVVVQGIGAADAVWDKAIRAASNVGATGSAPQVLSVGVQMTAQQIFQGMVCDASAKASYPVTQGAPYYCAQNPKDVFCTASPAFSDKTVTYDMGPNGVCGKLNLCDPDKTGATPLAKQFCDTQHEVLGALIPAVQVFAQTLVKADYEYRQFYNTSAFQTGSVPDWIKSYCDEKGLDGADCCVASDLPMMGTCKTPRSSFPAPDADNQPQSASAEAMDMYWKYYFLPIVQDTLKDIDIIMRLQKDYVDPLQDIVNKMFKEQAGKDIADKKLKEASDLGWMFAGAYYHELAKTNNQNLTDANPPFNVQVDFAKITKLSYRNNYYASAQLVTLSGEAAAGAKGSSSTVGAGGSGSSAPSQMGEMTREFDTLQGWITSAWMCAMSGEDPCRKEMTGVFTYTTKSPTIIVDPLSRLQQFGQTLLTAMEYAFLALLLLEFAITALATIVFIVAGTGPTVNPIGEGIKKAFDYLNTFLFWVITTFAVFGATLGVYIPLIPYMVFTFGVIGWFLLVIEAMVAGPIVALGLLSPGGRDELWGHAEHALMILFGIFLRPALMVFGMIFGMLLASVVLTMINTGFYGVMASLTGGKPGFLELIAYLAIYSSLVISAINKCFTPIYVLPDRILRWIGGTEEHTDMGALAEAKQMMGAGVTGGTEALGGASKGIGAAIGSSKKGEESGMLGVKKGGAAAKTGISGGSSPGGGGGGGAPGGGGGSAPGGGAGGGGGGGAPGGGAGGGGAPGGGAGGGGGGGGAGGGSDLSAS